MAHLSDWTDDEVLQRGAKTGQYGQYNTNLGWGAMAAKYLDPREEHDYATLPPDYEYHKQCAAWAVVPRSEPGFWHMGVGASTE